MQTGDKPHLEDLPDELETFVSEFGYEGKWAPIFLEPMTGSGERFTFAIAALGNDGAVRVERVIRPEVLKLFYGGKAKPLGEMLLTIEGALESSLSHGFGIPHHAPLPLEGFFVGHFRNALGRSIEDLIEQGKMMSASLASVVVGAQQVSDAEEFMLQTSEWARRVQKQVAVYAEDLAPYFDRSVLSKTSSIPQRFGFFNDYYAANFGVVRGDNPASSLYHLKSRLWDLENAAGDLAGELRGRDLILARPNLRDAKMSLQVRGRVQDVIDKVTSEADKHEIYVFHTHSVAKASRRVFEQARKMAA